MKIALYVASTGTIVDKLIDVYTGLHGYSHCEVVFDKIYGHQNDEYLCCSAAPREGKVRFKRIDIHSRHWYIVDVPEIDSPAKEREVYMFLKKLEGAKYDWKGIFLFFIFAFMKKQDDKKWWCSEVCGLVLHTFINTKQKYRISPNKLARVLHAPKQPFKFKLSIGKKF